MIMKQHEWTDVDAGSEWIYEGWLCWIAKDATGEWQLLAEPAGADMMEAWRPRVDYPLIARILALEAELAALRAGERGRQIELLEWFGAEVNNAFSQDRNHSLGMQYEEHLARKLAALRQEAAVKR